MRLNEIVQQNSDIDEICEEYGIENYTINEDGSIDVTGDVDLSKRKFTKLPLKFGKVGGYFYCYNCSNLTNLVGAPSSVGGDFYCSDCPNLTKLSHLKDIRKTLYFGSNIKNVLFALKIKNLKSIDSGNGKLDKIINKYLKGDRDIIDCQEELIEAGLKEYARLK